MELNFKLDDKRQALLKKFTTEQPIYCIRPDIDRDGKFTKDCFLGATKSFLFLFEGEKSEVYPLTDCKDVTHSLQTNGAIMLLKKDDGEHLLARCSMSEVSRFAYVARGIRLLISGKYDKKIISTENEKYCPECGRILPGTDYCPKCSKQHKTLERIIEICKPHKVAFVLISVLMLLDSAISISQGFILRFFVDRNLDKGVGTAADVLMFFLLYFGVIFIGFFVFYYKSYLCSKLGVSVARDLRKKLTDHIQKLSLSFLSRKEAGETVERVMGDTSRVQSFISNYMSNSFNQVITLIALSIVMLIISWRLAIAVFVFAPPVCIFAKFFWPYIRHISHRQWRKTDRIQNKLQDVLSGIRIVKTYGKESEEVEEFCRLNDDLAKAQHKSEKFYATFFPILSLIFSLSTCLITYLGGSRVLGGSMSVGELTQFVTYTGMLLAPLNWLTFLPRQIITMSTSMERIYDVLDEQPEITSKEGACPVKLKGNIEVDNVVFGYRNYEPVLSDISLNVKSGEMIGLVGHSGSGKSTFINLIMRLYDVDEGSIKIDGTDLRDMDLSDYHSQIGVVLQETFLFAGSVADNIRFAKPDATVEEIIEAAKAANAHDFICKLPDGYNTYVGEKGYSLSGGERQRIAIARAILGNPKILILDEATSALDTESEYQVQQALERLRKNRTTFAIAHRLSTLRCADRIAVIDDNKIAELGTHNQLLKKKGIYYSLVMAQLKMNKTAEDQ